jgi:hypothetical protein
MPTFCEPCPGKRNASLPIVHLLIPAGAADAAEYLT